jgi:hypothetical protein
VLTRAYLDGWVGAAPHSGQGTEGVSPGAGHPDHVGLAAAPDRSAQRTARGSAPGRVCAEEHQEVLDVHLAAAVEIGAGVGDSEELEEP